jgi:hypothetical protein
MDWLKWFDSNKDNYSRIHYKRGYDTLTHPQIQVMQDLMADVWLNDWFAKNK